NKCPRLPPGPGPSSPVGRFLDLGERGTHTAVPRRLAGGRRLPALCARRRLELRHWHTMLPMTQDGGELDSLVRKRIRALRVAQGWSLEELAGRANLSQSSLSRIENGRRRLALDQLVILARALDTTLDQLVETAAD